MAKDNDVKQVLNLISNTFSKFDKLIDNFNDKISKIPVNDKKGSDKKSNNLNFNSIVDSLSEIKDEISKSNDYLKKLSVGGVSGSGKTSRGGSEEKDKTSGFDFGNVGKKFKDLFGAPVVKLIDYLPKFNRIKPEGMRNFSKFVATLVFVDLKDSGEKEHFIKNEKDLNKTKELYNVLGDSLPVLKALSGVVLLYTLVSPLVPIAVKSLKQLLLGFIDLSKSTDPKKVKTLTEGLKNISYSLLLFTASFILLGLALPILAQSVIGFAIIVLSVIGVLWLVNKAIGDEDPEKLNKKGGLLSSLVNLGLGVLLFSISFILLSNFTGDIFKGLITFVFVLGLTIISLALLDFIFSGGKSNPVDGGGNKSKINDLLYLGLGIVLFTLTFYGLSFIAKEVLLGALTFMGVSILLSVGLRFLSGDDVESGTNNLLLLGISLAVFGLSLWIYDSLVAGINWTNVIILGGVILVLGLSAFFLGAFDDIVKKGIVNLYLLAGSLIVFSLGLWIYSKALEGMKSDWLLLVLPGVIVAMGAAAVDLGVLSEFAILGAIVLIILGVSFMAFSLGFKIMVDATKNLNDDKIKLLGSSIWTIGESIAEIGLLSPFVLLGSAALLPMSIGLLILGKGLEYMQKIRLTKKLGDNIKSVITGVVDAISYIDFSKVDENLGKFTGIGSFLSDLAEGVLAFVDMSFIKYEYDPKTGKSKEIGRVNVTPTDIQNAGKSIANVLMTLTKPLSDFAETVGGKSTGFFTGLFTGDKLEAGLDALSTLSGSLKNLADGVLSWADLKVAEYKVEKKNGQTILKPTGRFIRLTDDDLKSAAQNIANVISALADPLAQFADVVGGKSTGFFAGLFTGDKLEAGLDALSTLSGSLKNLADGVLGFTNLNKSGVDNFKNFFISVIDSMMTVMQKINANVKIIGSDNVDKSLDVFEKLTGYAKQISDIINESFGKNFNPKNLNNFDRFLKYFSNDKNVKTINTAYDLFSKLAKISNPFEKFANSFDKFANSMKIFSDNIKSLDKNLIDNLAKFNEYLYKSLEIGKYTESDYNNYFSKTSSIIGDQIKLTGNFNANQSQTKENSTTPTKQPTNQPTKAPSQPVDNTYKELSDKLNSVIQQLDNISKILNSNLNVNIVGSTTPLKVNPINTGGF